MTGRLSGKVVLVTGATGGLGLVCCRLLVREGARVVLSDLGDEAALERARAEVGGAIAIAADVTSEADATMLVARSVEELGSLDGCVAAAGLYHATPVDEIGTAEWDRIQAVNVRGAFFTARAALQVMVPRKTGAVVLLGSIAGQVGGVQSGAGYATSKAAVIGMAKALARHAGPHGVRVNCVNPGFIDSGMSLGIAPEDRERTIAATPLGRPGTAEEVAEALVWLVSDASSFVTGAQLDVNGGLLMA
jgi:3-oxoacyl-[acyl-carrier protein] reductase